MTDSDKKRRDLLQARLQRDPFVYRRPRPDDPNQTDAVRVVTRTQQANNHALRAEAVQQRLEAARNTGAEVVVPLDLGVHPDAGVSGEFVLQDSVNTFLTFRAVRPGPDGPIDAGTAIIRFRYIRASRFGLPNDEALGGHPLYERGLDYYAIGEVLNSTWAAEAERQNRVCFPDCPRWDTRHFVFTFHDSSFECLADDLTCELTSKPHSELVAELYAELANDG